MRNDQIFQKTSQKILKRYMSLPISRNKTKKCVPSWDAFQSVKKLQNSLNGLPQNRTSKKCLIKAVKTQWNPWIFTTFSDFHKGCSRTICILRQHLGKLFFHSTGSHTGNQEFLENNKDDHNWQRGNYSQRHHARIIMGKLPQKALRNANSQRLFVIYIDQNL